MPVLFRILWRHTSCIREGCWLLHAYEVKTMIPWEGKGSQVDRNVCENSGTLAQVRQRIPEPESW